MRPSTLFVLTSAVALMGIIAWVSFKSASPRQPITVESNALITPKMASEVSNQALAQDRWSESGNHNESTAHTPENEAVKPACVVNGKSPIFASGLAHTLAQEKPELGLSEADLSLVLKTIEQYSAQGEVYAPVDDQGVIRLKGEFEGRNVKSLSKEEKQKNGEAALIYGLWLAYYADTDSSNSNTENLHKHVNNVEEYLTRAYRLGQASALSSLNNYFENQSDMAWHLSDSDSDPLYQDINARATAYRELGEQYANHDWIFNDWVRSSLLANMPMVKNKLGQPKPALSSQEIEQIERKKLDISHAMQLKPRSAQQQREYDQLKWIRDQRDFIPIFESITEKCPQLNEHAE